LHNKKSLQFPQSDIWKFQEGNVASRSINTEQRRAGRNGQTHLGIVVNMQGTGTGTGLEKWEATKHRINLCKLRAANTILALSQNGTVLINRGNCKHKLAI
jgi:hypothetical protein